MIRVLQIEHQEFIRVGVSSCLSTHNQISIIGSVKHYNTALKMVGEIQPDIVLLDADLPDGDSLLLSHEINECMPSVKIFFLSNSLKPEIIRRAITRDICGYAMKSITCDELIFAIKSISTKRKYYSNEVINFLANDKQQTQLPSLTLRQSCILQHVGDGLNNKEMANKLSISVRTVECHKRNIMKKLNISRSPELIRYAIKLSMVDSALPWVRDQALS